MPITSVDIINSKYDDFHFSIAMNAPCNIA